MNVIFTDFNGVLNDFDKKSNQSSLSFKLLELSNFEAVINLVKFAKKHNALILSISTFEKQTPIFNVIARVIIHRQDDQELKDYIDDIKFDSRKYQRKLQGSKESAILNFISENKDLKYVSFEDDHNFSEKCHQVKVNSHKGLTLEDLEKAEKFFL